MNKLSRSNDSLAPAMIVRLTIYFGIGIFAGFTAYDLGASGTQILLVIVAWPPILASIIGRFASTGCL